METWDVMVLNTPVHEQCLRLMRLADSLRAANALQ